MERRRLTVIDGTGGEAEKAPEAGFDVVVVPWVEALGEIFVGLTERKVGQIDRMPLEAPRAILAKGETPVAAGLRALYTEAGLAKEIKLLGTALGARIYGAEFLEKDVVLSRSDESDEVTFEIGNWMKSWQARQKAGNFRFYYWPVVLDTDNYTQAAVGLLIKSKSAPKTRRF